MSARRPSLESTPAPRPAFEPEWLDVWAAGESLVSRALRWRADDAPAVAEPRRLEPWARAFAEGDADALARRLDWEGISSRGAAAALESAPPGGVPSEGEARAIAAYRGAAQRGDRAPDADRSSSAEALPFEALWLPWLDAVFDRETADTCEAVGIGSTARKALEHALLERLARSGELAALELFAKVRAAAPGREGLHDAFCAQLLRDGGGTFFAAYPVLLRQQTALAVDWRGAVHELCGRLRDDRADLAAAFGSAVRNVVRDLQVLDSDPHHGGRRVLALRFDDGLRIVYKPRDVANEAALAELCGWLAAAGCPDPPRAPRTVVRPGYGWQEWIEDEALDDASQARDYYRRAGSWLAVAHLLRARDLHAENLVATRGGPVVVDAEMLLQPDEARTGEARQRAPSVLATGLLPDPLRRGAAWRPGMGGFEAPVERQLGSGARKWSGVGTDEVRVDPAAVWSRPLANAVRLGAAWLAPQDHAGEILEGFRACCRFLVGRRGELLAPEGPLSRFAAARPRVLFRASQQYADLLALLVLPRHQKDGARAGLLLEGLLRPFAGSSTRPLLWPLVADERGALERLDLPRFTIAAGSRELEAETGERVSGVAALSGFEAVRRGIEELDEAEIERQAAFLEAALERLRGTSVPLRPDQPFVAEALRLGEALLRELAADRIPFRGPAPGSLAGGRGGVALFLAALYQRTGDERFRGAARRTLGGLVDTAPVALGGLVGRGGEIWTRVWLARLLGDPSLLDEASALARGVGAHLVARDHALDVHDGVAGLALAVLALWEERAEGHLIELGVACGERLLASRDAGGGWREESGLARLGFAHGGSGMARALAALARAAGDGRFADAARQAFESERNAFDAERGDWPVLWLDPAGALRRSWMTAWCRGAAGAALARGLAAPEGVDPAAVAELSSAIATLRVAPPAPVDFLCCGSLGRAAVLVDLGARLGRTDIAEAGRELARSAWRGAAERGAWNLGPQSEAPAGEWSLLKGLAGIGWQLLALEPGSPLPSLLALELPSEQRDRTRPPSKDAAPEPRQATAGSSTPGVSITRLEPGGAGDFEAMTFPVYRHLLSLRPGSRHPEQGDTRPIQPLAFAARAGESPAGLLLVEMPLGDRRPPEILSVFVAPQARRRGIASALVEAAETEIRRRGFAELDAVYTTGRPGAAIAEHLLDRRGWEAPETRTVLVQITPRDFLGSSLLEPNRLAALDPGFEYFAWADLDPAERQELIDSDARQPWVTKGLWAWKYDTEGFDRATSLGVRWRGAIVGWVISQRIDQRSVRYLASFLRKDLSRRSRILPVYRESLARGVRDGVELATWVTPMLYPSMIRFIQKWMAPHARLVAETRGRRRRFDPPAPLTVPGNGD